MAWRVGRGGQRQLESIVFAIVILCGAAVTVYALVHGHERAAVAFSVIPITAWLLTRPTLLLVPLGASIPVLLSITGSTDYGSGGIQITISDVLLVLITAGILLQRAFAKPVPIFAALKPVAFPVLVYSAVMLLLLAFHGSLHDALKTGQRFELFLVPILVGAFAAFTRWHIATLKAYVIVSTALALVFPVYGFGGQHNPVSQMIANAILVLLGVRALRRLYPLFAILVPGLIFSQSRGAILAAVVGVVVILLMQKLSSQQLLRRALPILLLAGVVFLFAPTSLRQRLTTLTPGTQSSAAYALTLRQQAWHDARAIAAAHPWTGVGIGDYGAADAAVDPNNQAQDPQDVILLQQAEGGYPLAVAFILLIGGTLVALWRMRQVELAAAAAGVIVATAAHGLVDVYWVRGTPLLGWLMLGMVCALARMRATGTATDAAT